MSEFQHFQCELNGRTSHLSLKDPRLADILLISELHDELLEFVETRQPQQLVIDFTGVKYCSTAVINGILRAKKRMLTSGGRLGLCAMCQDVRDAYRLLNLDGTVFKIYDSYEEAAAAFEKD